MQGITYCACGCGEPTLLSTVTNRGRGQVAGQPNRYLRGHNKRRAAGTPPMEGKARRTRWAEDECGCWVWQLEINERGYGRVSSGHKKMPAHRWSYERHVGPVPDGLELDHLCRNRACVNPAHLEVVTRAENMRRATSTKLTEGLVAEIRALGDGGWGFSDIGAAYGVHGDTVSRIVRRKSWKPVERMS
jgi:hypothetical protein